MPPITRAGIISQRQAIDTARQQAQLQPYPWSPIPASPPAVIRSAHFNELKEANQELWYRKRLGVVPQWTAGTMPSTSRTAVETDPMNIDTWYQDYISSDDGIAFQGIVSLSADQDNGMYVSDEWCQNARILTPPPADPLLIRTAISTRASDDVLLLSAYKNAIDTWRSNGFEVAVVLTPEFYRMPLDYNTGSWDPSTAANGPLSGLTNNYIEIFAERAADLAEELEPHGVNTYWIWNEPNVHSDQNTPSGQRPETRADLSPENFGALLYTVSTRMKSRVPSVECWAGSLSMVSGQTNPAAPGEYLDRAYGYIYEDNHVTVEAYQWTSISLNFLNPPSAGLPLEVREHVRDAIHKYHHYIPIILAEWGWEDVFGPNPPEHPPTSIPSQVLSAYLEFRPIYTLMYFMCHHHPGDKNYGATQWEPGPGNRFMKDFDRNWGYILRDLYLNY